MTETERDEPPVRLSEKMNLNPEPLKVVKVRLPRCRKCGGTWGMRGTCICLVGDPEESET